LHPFDVSPTKDAQLLQLDTKSGNKNIFLTHKACIENYLIDADLIHKYWAEKYREKQDNPVSKWGHGDSPGVEAISEWIQASAEKIRDYQVVRWALSDLIRESNTNLRLKTTWTGGSGNLPDPESLTIEDCSSQGIELIKQFKDSNKRVTEDDFKKSVGQYKALFSDSDFWSAKQYLNWFHGKDIQKAMQRENSQYISLEDFFEPAINKFDPTHFNDLMEFKEKIEKL
jgi:hypothetical protein